MFTFFVFLSILLFCGLQVDGIWWSKTKYKFGNQMVVWAVNHLLSWVQFQSRLLNYGHCAPDLVAYLAVPGYLFMVILIAWRLLNGVVGLQGYMGYYFAQCTMGSGASLSFWWRWCWLRVQSFWSGVLLGVSCRAQFVLSFVLPASPLRQLVWLGFFVFLFLHFFWYEALFSYWGFLVPL